MLGCTYSKHLLTETLIQTGYAASNRQNLLVPGPCRDSCPRAPRDIVPGRLGVSRALLGRDGLGHLSRDPTGTPRDTVWGGTGTVVFNILNAGPKPNPPFCSKTAPALNYEDLALNHEGLALHHEGLALNHEDEPRRFGLKPRRFGLEPRRFGLEPRRFGLEPRRSSRFKLLYGRGV